MSENEFFQPLLALHIVGGAIGLLAGTLNMVRRKGDLLHRQAGRVSALGMLSAGGSAIALSAIHPNFFLLLIAVFTIYLTLSGLLYIRLLKDMKIARGALTGLHIMMFFSGFGMMALGCRSEPMHLPISLASVVFGLIAIVMSLSGLSKLRTHVEDKRKLKSQHLQRMVAAYIASLTAFLVVNSRYAPDIPGIVLWLLPTVALTPVITFWSKKILAAPKEEPETPAAEEA